MRKMYIEPREKGLKRFWMVRDDGRHITIIDHLIHNKWFWFKYRIKHFIKSKTNT